MVVIPFMARGTGRVRTPRTPIAEGRGESLVDLRLANVAFVVLFLFGAVAVLLRANLKVAFPFATYLMWALACLAFGGGIGFLFGIPKVLQGSGPAPAPPASPVSGLLAPSGAAAAGTAAVLARLGYEQRVNTNLEEISDWLTKIIVGLGLIHLAQAPNVARILAHALAREVNPAAPEAAFAFSFGLILLFLVTGFLYGYLQTRMFLQSAFARADRQAQLLANAQMLRRELSSESDWGPEAALFSANFAPDDALLGNALTDDALPSDALPGAPTPREIAAAGRIARIPAGDDLTVIRRQVVELATRYETTRATMVSGDARTARMEMVVRDMQKLGLAVAPLLPELTASDSPGERLVAIASLQIRSAAEYLPWLGERITIEVPFLRYHAALALLSAARAFGLDPVQGPILAQTIQNAITFLEGNEGDVEKARRTDTYAVLQRAQELLPRR